MGRTAPTKTTAGGVINTREKLLLVGIWVIVASIAVPRGPKYAAGCPGTQTPETKPPKRERRLFANAEIYDSFVAKGCSQYLCFCSTAYSSLVVLQDESCNVSRSVAIALCFSVCRVCRDESQRSCSHETRLCAPEAQRVET